MRFKEYWDAYRARVARGLHPIPASVRNFLHREKRDYLEWIKVLCPVSPEGYEFKMHGSGRVSRCPRCYKLGHTRAGCPKMWWELERETFRSIAHNRTPKNPRFASSLKFADRDWEHWNQEKIYEENGDRPVFNESDIERWDSIHYGEDRPPSGLGDLRRGRGP